MDLLVLDGPRLCGYDINTKNTALVPSLIVK